MNHEIIIDSREQKYKHIAKYFDKNKIDWKVDKLDVGDYQLVSNKFLSIDKKADIMELAGNVCGKDHERLRREIVRAQKNNIKLIFLIEEDYTFETLCNWVSPVWKYGPKKGQLISKVNGETLSKAIQTMQEKYGCEFRFVKKENSGKAIVSILTECFNGGEDINVDTE